MSLHLLAIAVALAVPPAAPRPAAAPPPQLHVTGPTTAGPAIVADALQEVQRFSGAALKCSDVTAVNASAMPANWQPSDANFRLGPAGTRYERWDVTLCGRVEPFLLGFWNEPAGPAYQVGHPFPADHASIPAPH